MQKYILITGDYNDGDYDTRMTAITDAEIELIRPVVATIIENDGDYCNRETADRYHSAKLSYGHLKGFEIFDECAPRGESNFHGIHTIESVKIITILEELM